MLALAVSALWPHEYVFIVDGHFDSKFLLGLGLDSWHGLVTNAAMTIFFLVVGLELSWEIRKGALRTLHSAAMPMVAAFGGMVASALTLWFLGRGLSNPSIQSGWGVPTATDIAFTLGVLSLAGRRVPPTLRSFLLALAVADDVLAVTLLAFISPHGVRVWWLVTGVFALAMFVTFGRRSPGAIVGSVIFVWLCLLAAHVEPALAGVFVGVLAPFGPRDAGPKLIKLITPISSGVVLPIFAFTACGVLWHDVRWSGQLGQLLGATVVARLGGKFFGITGAMLVGRKIGLRIPAELTVGVIASASLFCAVGFTVPLLFAGSVYGVGTSAYYSVTTGLLIGSVLAGAVGVVSLRLVLSRRKKLGKLNGEGDQHEDSAH